MQEERELSKSPPRNVSPQPRNEFSMPIDDENETASYENNNHYGFDSQPSVGINERGSIIQEDDLFDETKE
mgnify:CR=1 FL=1